jgi:nucleobase:cation symporter-1, NCS1 family
MATTEPTLHGDRLPSGDRPFHVEVYGADEIPLEDLHGTARELFWLWFTANMAMVSFVYGIVLAGYALNLWQGLFVLLVGVGGSFVLVSILSLAGTCGHRPMLALSRASFGKTGNIFPSLVSWLSLVGWEIVGIVLASYALLGLLGEAGIPATTGWTALCLAASASIVVLTGIFGHATIIRIQRWVTLTFGILTLLIAGYLAWGTNWPAVFATVPGPFTGVLAALSIVAAGTGIGWLNAGADYTRYLPGNTRPRSIVGWTTTGATLPILVVALVGYLLTGRIHGLATASNPLTAINAVLPVWMAVPFLLTAAIGLLAGAVESIYSSGLSLLAVGIRIPRWQCVLIDGVLMILGSIYTLFIASSFLGTFESYLEVVSVPLTAWAAVFLIDMANWRGVYPTRLKEGVAWRALGAWLIGIVVGLLFTSSPLKNGPLAVGFFATASFGYVFSFLVSLACYAVFLRVFPTAASVPEQTKDQVPI